MAFLMYLSAAVGSVLGVIELITRVLPYALLNSLG
jgi:hypothetical protein